MLTLLLLWTATADPAVWPAFLGAGSSPQATESLPLTWSPEENHAWAHPLPGHGQSSPVIWGERVFVTSVEGPMKDTYHLACIDLRSGEQRWIRELANSSPVKNSYYVSRAAPTPVVDADRVVAFFESGDCVAYDHSGKKLWQRDLAQDEGPFDAEFGLGSSPCQNATHVFCLMEHAGPGSLVALDKRTGLTTWRVPREPRRSWASPTVIKIDGQEQLVVSSAGTIDGFDVATGDRLWRFEDVGGNNATTPIDVGDGRFLVGAAPGRSGEASDFSEDSNALMRVRKDGEDWALEREWIAEGARPSWASPIVHDGLAYWINRAGAVQCFQAKTGQQVYVERIEQSCWATPIGVGDRIYFFGKEGLVTVLAAGEEFNVLAENQSWDEETLPGEPLLQENSPDRQRGVAMFSKPTLYGAAVAGDSIVVRVGNGLICVRVDGAAH